MKTSNLPTKIEFGDEDLSLKVNCPDEDNDMLVEIDHQGVYQSYYLSMEEAEDLRDFLTAHIENYYSILGIDLHKKPFWFSIKPVDACLFSRREGIKGIRIFGYSICLRLFGINLI